jgi:hypothetical protein
MPPNACRELSTRPQNTDCQRTAIFIFNAMRNPSTAFLAEFDFSIFPNEFQGALLLWVILILLPIGYSRTFSHSVIIFALPA